MNIVLEKGSSIRVQIEELTSLIEKLKSADSVKKKIGILDEQNAVKDFFVDEHWMTNLLADLPDNSLYVVKSLLVIGQGREIFYVPEEMKQSRDALEQLIEDLLPVELFYQAIGGLIGYHCTTLRLLLENDKELPSSTTLLPVLGENICEENESVRQAILWGIEKLECFAEIYPVGGAADRLRLQDEKTGNFLPAAKLVFCGKTLIEKLVIDLQAREYLHYKLFGKQVITPLAMMTSNEKDNHAQVLSIFEENGWFGRPKDQFRFFLNPWYLQ